MISGDKRGGIYTFTYQDLIEEVVQPGQPLGRSFFVYRPPAVLIREARTNPVVCAPDSSKTCVAEGDSPATLRPPLYLSLGVWSEHLLLMAADLALMVLGLVRLTP